MDRHAARHQVPGRALGARAAVWRRSRPPPRCSRPGYLRAAAAVRADRRPRGRRPAYATRSWWSPPPAPTRPVRRRSTTRTSRQPGARPRRRALARHFGQPIAAEDTDTLVTGRRRRSDAMARLAYREGVCAHLVITGKCASCATARSWSASDRPSRARHQGRRRDPDRSTSARPTVGAAPELAAHTSRVKVVGLYTPDRPERPRTGARNAYFAERRRPDRRHAARGWTRCSPRPSRTSATDPPARVDCTWRSRSAPDRSRVDQVAALRADLTAFVVVDQGRRASPSTPG